MTSIEQQPPDDISAVATTGTSEAADEPRERVFTEWVDLDALRGAILPFEPSRQSAAASEQLEASEDEAPETRRQRSGTVLHASAVVHSATLPFEPQQRPPATPNSRRSAEPTPKALDPRARNATPAYPPTRTRRPALPFATESFAPPSFAPPSFAPPLAPFNEAVHPQPPIAVFNEPAPLQAPRFTAVAPLGNGEKADPPSFADVPLQLYATVKAATLDGAALADVLAAHQLDELRWRRAQRQLAVLVAGESAAGRSTTSKSLDAAIAAARKRPSDGVIAPDIELYATIRAELEASQDPTAVLQELGLTVERWQQLRRACMRRALADEQVAAEVRKQLQAARRQLMDH